MGALARASGVPASTIKHYIAERLLPRAMMLVDRNSALYAPDCVALIQRVKEMQTVHFLPLWRIREVLQEGADPRRATVEAAVDRVLDGRPLRQVSRKRLFASGLREEELRALVRLGALKDADSFAGDDLALLEAVIDAHTAGLTTLLDVAEVLRRYRDAVRELVEVELEIFTSTIMPGSGADLARLTEDAMRVSERLVLLFRRRQLLPMLASAMPPPREKKRARR